MNDLKHVNPNCLDARYCLEHGETGPVSYSVGAIHRIRSLETEKFLCSHCQTLWTMCQCELNMNYISKNDFFRLKTRFRKRKAAFKDRMAKMQAEIDKLKVPAEETRRNAWQAYGRLLRALMGNEVADTFSEKMAKGWANLMKFLDEEDKKVPAPK